MKVLVQWTKSEPEDWIEIDSANWLLLPKKPIPISASKVDNNPGWIYDMNIQGLCLNGKDHYHIKDLDDGSGGIEITTWNDDSEDIVPDEFYAEVWRILPLASDNNLGGAINTRQSRVVYAAPAAHVRWTENSLPEKTELKTWVEFAPPLDEEVYHGIWVNNKLAAQHKATQSFNEWRGWGAHLDPLELDGNGLVKSQRIQGRWKKAKGTITYFLHDTALATGLHTADQEDEMEETDIASSVASSATINAESTEITHVWTTLSNSPGFSDWPNGEYRCQIDVGAAESIGGYGFLARGGALGHFSRVNSGLNSHEETWTQDETAFIGTGIKLATNTIDPASGAVGDRFECAIAANNTDTMSSKTLIIRVDDSDSFADGPWTVAVVSNVFQNKFKKRLPHLVK